MLESLKTLRLVLGELGEFIESVVGQKTWSTIKGLLIAFGGVLLLQIVEKIAPGTVPVDMKTQLTLAAVTSALNFMKQLALPSTPTA